MTCEVKVEKLKEVAADKQYGFHLFSYENQYLSVQKGAANFECLEILQGLNGFIRTEYSISKQQNELFQYLDTDH